MVAQHYRWDFIGLSTDTKPTPATSEKVTDGSTFYCSDNSKLYVWYNDEWYEKTVSGGGGTTYTAGDNIQISDDNVISATNTTYTAGSNVQISDENVISATDTTYSNFVGTDGVDAGTAGLVPAPAVADADKFLKSDGTWSVAGGGGPTVVQTTGTSTTDVMSQNATTNIVFTDPQYRSKVRIGNGATATGNNSVAIGVDSNAGGSAAVALGYKSYTSAVAAVALPLSIATTKGEFNVGTGAESSVGYNNSDYRLITGVYDGQSAHDAATYGQMNTRLGGLTLFTISQTDYDNLGTKDPDTLYVITGA